MRCKAPEFTLSTPRALVVAKSEAPTSYSGRWRELRSPVYIPDVPGTPLACVLPAALLACSGPFTSFPELSDAAVRRGVLTGVCLPG